VTHDFGCQQLLLDWFVVLAALLVCADRSVRKRPLLVWRMAWLCGPNRPPQVPEGYVITPFVFPSSCVLRAVEERRSWPMGASNMRMERPMRTLRPAGIHVTRPAEPL